jgi:alkanesulfonate monooxygenase SsuD/methylene tetrahydromethanopterin reductase-like flavin-dependent oxidoreductase (luciferase family)
MSHRISIGIDWQGSLDRERAFDYVRAADEAGVETVWVAEAWGRDAFSMLTQLAERTQNIQLGTAIVNVFSRTPGALAQHFATLDELSGGRAIIGLGSSGANVVEHFHGVPFDKPLRRVREYVEIINTLMANKPLNYEGEIFHMGRGFTLRFTPVREHIPIYIASLTPRSTRQTAAIADGWLPVMIPLKGLAGEITAFREQVVKAGRDLHSVTVRAPGGVSVTSRPEAARLRMNGTMAFYLARMGTFYYEQVSRLGFADEAAVIRRAWAEGGSGAGTAAITAEMEEQFGYAGSVAGAIDRIEEQVAAGADLHGVQVDAETPREAQAIFARLVG